MPPVRLEDPRPGPDPSTEVTGGLEPQSVRFRSGALELRALVWGRPEDPTALLLHGNGAHAHWWDTLVPHLVPGWRLLVPDLRGHGESDWPEQPDYQGREIAADVERLVDLLAPERFALVGHSMGGRLAAWLATRHPSRARGLAVLDSHLMPFPSGAWVPIREKLLGAREGKAYPSFEEAVRAFRFVPDEAGVAAVVRETCAWHAIRRRAPGEWTFRFDRGVLAVGGDRLGDLVESVVGLECPVWVARGRSSRLAPAELDRIRELRPGIEVHVFPGSHHFLLSHPKPVGEALRGFLDGLAGTGTVFTSSPRARG